jgi:hypothetical protein
VDVFADFFKKIDALAAIGHLTLEDRRNHFAMRAPSSNPPQLLAGYGYQLLHANGIQVLHGIVLASKKNFKNRRASTISLGRFANDIRHVKARPQFLRRGTRKM